MTDLSPDTLAAIKASADDYASGRTHVRPPPSDIYRLLAAYEAVTAERDTLKATLDKVVADTLRGVDAPLSIAYMTLSDMPDSAERRFVGHCIHATMKRLSGQWGLATDRRADRLWFEDLLEAFRKRAAER